MNRSRQGGDSLCCDKAHSIITKEKGWYTVRLRAFTRHGLRKITKSIVAVFERRESLHCREEEQTYGGILESLEHAQNNKAK